jgi:hypothetical protein
MSLVGCRECKQNVSTQASICPHCGCPTPDPFKHGWQVFTGILGFVLFIIIVLAIVYFFSQLH